MQCFGVQDIAYLSIILPFMRLVMQLLRNGSKHPAQYGHVDFVKRQFYAQYYGFLFIVMQDASHTLAI